MMWILPYSLKYCESVVLQVVFLKRYLSRQIEFEVYTNFCGSSKDTTALISYLHRIDVKKVAFLPDLVDEEAPVRK